MDEPRTEWPADLREVLGAGKELSGSGELWTAPAGIHALVYEISIRPFRDGNIRRADRPAAGSFARTDYRSADSRVVRNRHRRRNPAAVGRGARRRSLRRAPLPTAAGFRLR